MVRKGPGSLLVGTLLAGGCGPGNAPPAQPTDPAPPPAQPADADPPAPSPAEPPPPDPLAGMTDEPAIGEERKS